MCIIKFNDSCYHSLGKLSPEEEKMTNGSCGSVDLYLVIVLESVTFYLRNLCPVALMISFI